MAGFGEHALARDGVSQSRGKRHGRLNYSMDMSLNLPMTLHPTWGRRVSIFFSTEHSGLRDHHPDSRSSKFFERCRCPAAVCHFWHNFSHVDLQESKRSGSLATRVPSQLCLLFVDWHPWHPFNIDSVSSFLLVLASRMAAKTRWQTKLPYKPFF